MNHCHTLLENNILFAGSIGPAQKLQHSGVAIWMELCRQVNELHLKYCVSFDPILSLLQT
jgi:hypothetical protein